MQPLREITKKKGKIKNEHRDTTKDTSKGMMRKSLRVQGHTILGWKDPLKFLERRVGEDSLWGILSFSNSRGKAHIQKIRISMG